MLKLVGTLPWSLSAILQSAKGEQAQFLELVLGSIMIRFSPTELVKATFERRARIERFGSNSAQTAEPAFIIKHIFVLE